MPTGTYSIVESKLPVAGIGYHDLLDFAEKGPPEWLYLGKNEAIVIAPTYGSGETGGKPYAVYRHIKGRSEDPGPEGVDVPTAPPGYDAIRLAQ